MYTYPDNFRAYKALIAAEYSGAKVKVATDFVFGQTNKSEAFLAKFPTGKVSIFAYISIHRPHLYSSFNDSKLADNEMQFFFVGFDGDAKAPCYD